MAKSNRRFLSQQSNHQRNNQRRSSSQFDGLFERFVALCSDYSPLSLPMTNDFLTIKQAAKLTGKSEVTIRRLIKRLLKNRTAQTDQMINLTNRHGSSVYKIERRFLIEHVNLTEDRKQELLSATSQSPTQTNSQIDDDQGLNNQTPSPTDQTTSGSDTTSEQSAYSSGPLSTQATNQSPIQTTQVDPTNDDRAARRDDQPGHSPTQTIGHFSEEGLQLLKTTLDQLTRQLDKKDDQIAAKDDQLSKLDKQLSVERERNEKLTQIIEQGNVLVQFGPATNSASR